MEQMKEKITVSRETVEALDTLTVREVQIILG